MSAFFYLSVPYYIHRTENDKQNLCLSLFSFRPEAVILLEQVFAMDVRELIGKRIKGLRQGEGISQEVLAEKIDMSPKYLSSIERGKENPTLGTFIKLAQALDVEVSELFSYEHERPKKELTELISRALKQSDEDKFRLTAKIIKAIYR
jgi:transcriptional regulator with XRE-family HTH domain